MSWSSVRRTYVTVQSQASSFFQISPRQHAIGSRSSLGSPLQISPLGVQHIIAHYFSARNWFTLLSRISSPDLAPRRSAHTFLSRCSRNWFSTFLSPTSAHCRLTKKPGRWQVQDANQQLLRFLAFRAHLLLRQSERVLVDSIKQVSLPLRFRLYTCPITLMLGCTSIYPVVY